MDELHKDTFTLHPKSFMFKQNSDEPETKEINNFDHHSGEINGSHLYTGNV